MINLQRREELKKEIVELCKDKTLEEADYMKKLINEEMYDMQFRNRSEYSK